MTEYMEVMKQQKRMCKYYEKISNSCEGCPLHEEEIAYICCEAPCVIDNKDVDKAEKLISAWAAEHPEMVYPSWGIWLTKQGIIRDETIISEFTYKAISDKFFDPIDADTAEKLGIEPKEDIC